MARVKAGVFYGWFVVMACFVVLLSTSGAQNSFGLLFKPMLLDMGWDRATLSLGFSINMIFYGISQPIMGRLADQFGPRLVIGACAVLIAIGFALLGTVSEIWQVYLYYGVIAAVGLGGIAPVTVSAIIAKWFVRRRGLALSIATAGLATGQMVIIPISAAVVVASGWRITGMWLAAMVFVVVLFMAGIVMRSSPADVGSHPDGAKGPVAEPGAGPAGHGSVAERRVPLAMALRQPSFWQLSAGFFVCGFTWSLVVTHLVPFALDQGISEMMTANALSLMAFISVIGSLLIGSLSDRYRKNFILALLYLLRGSSFLILPWVNSVPLLYIFAVAHGSGRLATVPVTSTLTGELYGRASLGTVLGMIFLVHQIGAALGSYTGGVFFDRTGSYMGAFYVAAFLGLAASAISFSMDVKRRPIDILAAKST